MGVSYNTAWILNHKLMQTIREQDDSQPLRGVVELDDAYSGGETSGGKRGRGAERKTPFVAAAQVDLNQTRQLVLIGSRVVGEPRCHLIGISASILGRDELDGTDDTVSSVGCVLRGQKSNHDPPRRLLATMQVHYVGVGTFEIHKSAVVD